MKKRNGILKHIWAAVFIKWKTNDNKKSNISLRNNVDKEEEPNYMKHSLCNMLLPEKKMNLKITIAECQCLAMATVEWMNSSFYLRKKWGRTNIDR